MDVGFGIVIGTVLRWVYNAVKNSLGLSDLAAAWGIIILTLIIATGYNIATGGFVGIEFDVSQPLKCLEAITLAWTTIFGTASAWYPLTKKREKKE